MALSAADQAQILAAFETALSSQGGSSPSGQSGSSLNSQIELGRTQQQQAELDTFGLGGLSTSIDTLTGVVGGVGNAAIKIPETALEFFRGQYEQNREKTFKYLYDFREGFGGFSEDMFAVQGGIQGIAGKAITTAEEIFQLSSENVSDDMAAKYGAVAEVLQKSFESPEQAADAFKHTFNAIGSEIPTILEELNEVELAELTSLKQNLNISEREMGVLLRRQFAYTGEASAEIIGNIGKHADKMAAATGLSANALKKQIIDITTDVQTFGNIGVDSAARLGAALQQVGLEVEDLSSLVSSFDTFDSAATKIGDLSAMFDIQLDAMEMTYLANEDQEEFLFRMREEMLDSGVDIENMSHARSKALADTMGLSILQMKSFLDEGSLQMDQADLMQVTEEADMDKDYDNITSAMTKFGDENARVMADARDRVDNFRKSALIGTREELMQTALTAKDTYDFIFDQIDLQNEEIPKLLKAQADHLDEAMGSDETLQSIENITTSLNKGFDDAIVGLRKGLEDLTGETLASPEVRQVVAFDIPDRLYQSNKEVTDAAKEVVDANAKQVANNQLLADAISKSAEKDKTINLQVTFDSKGNVKEAVTTEGVLNVADATV